MEDNVTTEWGLSNVLSTGLVIAAMGTGSLLIALYLFQDKLLYFPTVPGDARTVFVPSSNVGLKRELEEVFFTTPDNLKIQAYFVKHSRSTQVPTILYFHGNAGNLSYRLPNVKRLHSSDVGCNVLIVSYRGYGKSEGTPSEGGIQIDAQTALNWLIEHPDIDPKKIIVFGRSLGGAAAIKLTADNQDKVAGLMVENTFTSIGDMIDIVLPWLSFVKALSSNKWYSKETIKNISVPILFLSGSQDELVPSHMMHELHDSATACSHKQFAAFDTGSHMDTWMQPGYYGVVKNWIDHVFNPESDSDSD